MRVTENSITDNYLYNQQQILKSKTKIQIQLATNSKLQTLSDDVSASLESIKINSHMKRTDTYLKNAESVKQFMTTALNSLSDMTTEIQKIITLTVEANNQLNESNFGIMAESVKASLSSIVQNVSTKHNDVPLFNGTNFKDIPVILDADGKAVLSNADFSGEIKAQVSQDVKQTLNIPGSKILSSGIFQAVNSIIDSLNAGIIPTIDQKADLENAYNQILDLQSLGGQTMNRMDDLNEMLTNNQANLNQMLADKQGIDPAALAMDLQYKDYLLEMTNKLLANNYPKSLFDYL